MTVMSAQRSTVCGNCRTPIAIGEQIDWSKDRGARHVSCTFAGEPTGDLKRAVDHLVSQRATGKLDKFARSLLEQWESRGWLSERQVTAVCSRLTDKPQVVQALPSPREVPAGRYALTLERDGVKREFLVHVWRGSRNPDFVRLYEYDSGNQVDTGPRGAEIRSDMLQRILETGVEAAAVRFGQLRKRCFRCDARLSDKVSVELSMGKDVCMKYVVPDPEARKQRRAQARAAIRARGEDPNQPAQMQLETT